MKRNFQVQIHTYIHIYSTYIHTHIHIYIHAYISKSTFSWNQNFLGGFNGQLEKRHEILFLYMITTIKLLYVQKWKDSEIHIVGLDGKNDWTSREDKMNLFDYRKIKATFTGDWKPLVEFLLKEEKINLAFICLEIRRKVWCKLRKTVKYKCICNYCQEDQKRLNFSFPFLFFLFYLFFYVFTFLLLFIYYS